MLNLRHQLCCWQETAVVLYQWKASLNWEAFFLLKKQAFDGPKPLKKVNQNHKTNHEF